MRDMSASLFPALALGLLSPCASATAADVVAAEDSQSAISEAEAQQIFDYAYPLVIMKISQDLMFTVPIRERSVPNHFIHFKRLAMPQNKAVVLGNRNTLYSVGWIDLSKGPVVFEIPDMGERYYVLPLLDAWTNTFKSFGSRTTGQRAQKYFIVNSDWNGKVPAGYEKVVSPTNMVWITGRIQADSPQDAAAAGQLQDAFKLMTYAQNQGASDPFANYKPEYMAMQVRKPVPYSLKMTAENFYNSFFGMWLANASPEEDAPLIRTLAKAGIHRTKTHRFTDLSPAVQETLRNGLKAKQVKYLKDFYDGTSQTEPWIFNRQRMGTWGTDFERRTYWAMWGLGANLVEDAVYGVSQLDDTLTPLDGSNVYKMHFGTHDLPPTSAFWSVTNYDEEGYLEANAENRYSLGSNHELKYNPDGSLDFYLSNSKPDIANVNWVPAPKGNFKTLLRIYWPDEKILRGEWALPPLKLFKGSE
ncbi:hypothetical protein A8B75_09775 [Sphingomonadales bacterium EhC05]|nr:hypothetical protein A8B75_09775 [Sphingomonadales bacterium EhC05]